EQVRQRLRHAECDDEREDRGARCQAEITLGQERQNCTFEAHHAANEGIDDHQQQELPPVGPEAENNPVRGSTHKRAGSRPLGVPRSTSPPAARHSSMPSAISARFSYPRCSSTDCAVAARCPCPQWIASSRSCGKCNSAHGSAPASTSSACAA